MRLALPRLASLLVPRQSVSSSVRQKRWMLPILRSAHSEAPKPRARFKSAHPNSRRLDRQLRSEMLSGYRSLLRAARKVREFDEQCADFVVWRTKERFTRHRAIMSQSRRIDRVKEIRTALRHLRGVQRKELGACVRLVSQAYGLTGRWKHILASRIYRARLHPAAGAASMASRELMLPPSMMQQVRYCERNALLAPRQPEGSKSMLQRKKGTPSLEVSDAFPMDPRDPDAPAYTGKRFRHLLHIDGVFLVGYLEENFVCNGLLSPRWARRVLLHCMESSRTARRQHLRKPR